MAEVKVEDSVCCVGRDISRKETCEMVRNVINQIMDEHLRIGLPMTSEASMLVNATKQQIIARLIELFHNPALDRDDSLESAEFDKLEAEYIAKHGEWQFSLALGRILVDIATSEPVTCHRQK